VIEVSGEKWAKTVMKNWPIQHRVVSGLFATWLFLSGTGALRLGAQTLTGTILGTVVDTGRQIESRQLRDMPLPYNRSYQGLLMLVPGTSRPYRTNSEFFNAVDSIAVNVNGQQRRANNFRLEGVDNNQGSGDGLTSLVPSYEAISVVDMTTSNFNAEFGRASGAVINVTLKSGTNDIHGSLFEYHKNKNMQARDFFASTKAPIVYNQFGGAIGGPIVRNDARQFELGFRLQF